MRQVKLFVCEGQGIAPFQKEVNDFLLMVQRNGKVHAVTLTSDEGWAMVMVDFTHPRAEMLASGLLGD